MATQILPDPGCSRYVDLDPDPRYQDPKKMPTKSPSWHPTPTAPATWHGQNGKGDQQDQLFGILRKMVKHGEFPWKKCR